MRRKFAIPALMVALLFPALALADDEPLEKLIAKADSAGDHQAEFCADVARREVELANQYYSTGDTGKAQAAVKLVIQYAEKSLDSAKHYHKKLKETEITLRKAARRLNDVGQTLAFEDRPPVHQAVEKIEQIRTELLDFMFAPKDPEKRR